jgi:hypothetical protein
MNGLAEVRTCMLRFAKGGENAWMDAQVLPVWYERCALKTAWAKTRPGHLDRKRSVLYL